MEVSPSRQSRDRACVEQNVAPVAAALEEPADVDDVADAHAVSDSVHVVERELVVDDLEDHFEAVSGGLGRSTTSTTSTTSSVWC